MVVVSLGPTLVGHDYKGNTAKNEDMRVARDKKEW
jgi:hypothetical protein